MRREHLDVHPLRASRPQVVHEIEQRELRSVGLSMKHALSGEDAVNLHSVYPADKLALPVGQVLPGFNAMGMSCAVEGDIGLEHGPGDPGASLTRTLGFRAGP